MGVELVFAVGQRSDVAAAHRYAAPCHIEQHHTCFIHVDLLLREVRSFLALQTLAPRHRETTSCLLSTLVAAFAA